MSAVAGARSRPIARGVLFAFLLLPAGTLARPALAQDPPPRDTIPVRADTLPAVAQEPDTVVVPAVRFPAMPLAPTVSAAGTQWVWDRETLLREAHVSLIDLLERIPGITTFRGGTFAQPEAASVFAGTAARTEIVIDGFVLDPLAASTFDLSQLALGHLREVRVQRRLGLLRIILTTEFPVEGRPYTRVEAGIGIPTANLFRGLFLVPHVIAGPLALGIERIDTDGINRSEPAGVFSGWAKWSWTNGVRGAQVEWIRSTLRRQPSSPWLLDRVRQDIVLRARNQFAPNFVAEAYVGRSQLDETIPPPPDDPEAVEIRTDRESIQAGLRAGLQLPWAAVNGSVRYRSQARLPVLEAQLDAETVLGPLRLAGEASISAWDGSYPTSYTSVRGELGRLLGASAFAELTRGTRGAPAFEDSIGDGVMLPDRSGWRAGVSLDLGRASGSVALVRVDQEFTWPFGLPFDRHALPDAVDAAEGVEAHGRVVIWPGYLTLSSWITDWRESQRWTYLPSRSWRTVLELHALPLPSGNLEIFGRAEAHLRGSVLAYDPAPAAGSSPYVTLPAHTTADGYLQIRIIDVRIFIRWEDILDVDIEEVPGRIYRGPRIFYGVKWDLRN